MRDAKSVNNETLLGRIPLFQDFSSEVLQQLAKTSKTLIFEKNGTLFRPGETCSCLHVVACGQIKLVFSTPQGTEKVVDILSVGQTFGEAELLLEKPYRAQAQALGDALVLQISKVTILNLITHNADFAHKLLTGMSQRLHELMIDLEGYTLHTGATRLLTFLAREAAVQEPRKESVVVRLSAPKGVIASRLNLTPEYFSRLLHELSEQGFFAIHGRNISIDSVSRLQRGLA